MLKSLLILIIFLSINSNASSNEKEIFEGWPSEAGQNFASPITTDARKPLIIGALLTGLIVVTKLSDPTQEEAVEGKPLGKYSKLGDYSGKGIPNTIYIVGMLGHGLLNSDNEATRNSLGMLQATAYSAAVTFHLKYFFNQERPQSEKNSEFPGRVERDSFPSGHATTAFAFASYIGCRNSVAWGAAAYTLATFTAYTRMNENRHYLHDVVAGATLGTSYGLGVCLSENKQKAALDSGDSQVNWFISPFNDGALGRVTIDF